MWRVAHSCHLYPYAYSDTCLYLPYEERYICVYVLTHMCMDTPRRKREDISFHNHFAIFFGAQLYNPEDMDISWLDKNLRVHSAFEWQL